MVASINKGPALESGGGSEGSVILRRVVVEGVSVGTARLGSSVLLMCMSLIPTPKPAVAVISAMVGVGDEVDGRGGCDVIGEWGVLWDALWGVGV